MCLVSQLRPQEGSLDLSELLKGTTLLLIESTAAQKGKLWFKKIQSIRSKGTFPCFSFSLHCAGTSWQQWLTLLLCGISWHLTSDSCSTRNWQILGKLYVRHVFEQRKPHALQTENHLSCKACQFGITAPPHKWMGRKWKWTFWPLMRNPPGSTVSRLGLSDFMVMFVVVSWPYCTYTSHTTENLCTNSG